MDRNTIVFVYFHFMGFILLFKGQILIISKNVDNPGQSYGGHFEKNKSHVSDILT